MRNVCWDGYRCCPTCYEINNNPYNPGSSNYCEDCMLIGGYFVHDQDSVPAGCPDQTSDLLIPLDRNDYTACSGSITVSIWDYDDTYFEDPVITYVGGETVISVRIKAEIPHMEYADIIYKVMCSDGHGGFGKVRVASKHNCLDCSGDCDNCTGICDEESGELDLGGEVQIL